MKRILFCLLVCVAFARADSISNYVLINEPTGSAAYDPSAPSLAASGATFDGGSFNFSASGAPLYGGRFATGYLTVNAAGFSLVGVLSKIYFNPMTGLFQGAFVGELREAGQTLHLYHAVFYESINLGGGAFARQGTLAGGHVVFSTAPEPESLWLFETGLIGIFGKKIRGRLSAERNHGK